MKLSDYVFDFVARQGVRDVFLLPGGGCMHLVDSLGRNRQLRYIAMLHEQAAAIAADAYAQASDGLGVALVTTGPGGTNALTGVAGAHLDSTPCLFISGQVKRADLHHRFGVRQLGFQEIDIVATVTPLTKYAVLVTEPNDIRYHLEKAVWLALHGRPGPVWIDIPLDVQAANVDPDAMRAFDRAELVTAVDEAAIDRAACRAFEALMRAERPAILVGNGARLAHAEAAVVAMARALDVPILLSWKEVDLLDEDDPLNAGRPGAIAPRFANFAQQNADWLLCLGARLDAGQTAYNHAAFARGAHKFVVDVDAAELRKLEMRPLETVEADVATFVRAFQRHAANAPRRDRSAWHARIAEWKRRYPIQLASYRAEPNVNNYVLIDTLSRALRPTDLVVPGSSGACSEVTMQAIRVQRGMRVLNTQGLGSMGFGIAASIGACLASGGRRTVTIEGDGGFIMNVQELETVRRLNLPIKFFVLSNDGYASIRSSQRNYFDGRFVASGAASGLTLPDYVKVASAFGIAAERVASVAALDEVVARAFAHPGPYLVDVVVSPEQITQPRITSRQLPNGSMVSLPMEDLVPLLSREELRENMIVPLLPESE
ncbi:MAG: thiamine pyrophosphate-binding protein [Polyangiales bacterium]